MKNISVKLLAGLLALSAMALSCKEDPMMTLASPTLLEFSFDGGPATISFTVNRPWTATVSQDWCSLGQESGQGGEIAIPLTVAANQNTDPRSCTVTVKSEAATYYISVKQAQRPELIPMSSHIDLAWSDNSFTLATQYNQDYTIRIEGGDWITRAETKSLSFGQEFFLVEHNRTLASRSVTLYLETEGASASIDVVQGPYTHRILEETEPGFYGFNSSDTIYLPEHHQIGITRYPSTVSFRILGPADGVMAEVSGIPSGIKEGDTFNGSVSIIKDGALEASYNGPILVLKTSGDLYWLTVTDEDGIIARI